MGGRTGWPARRGFVEGGPIDCSARGRDNACLAFQEASHRRALDALVPPDPTGTGRTFKDPKSLAGINPALVRHAVEHFQSEDVMRFLGRKAHTNFTGDLNTSFKDRPEGVRVKHWARVHQDL